jgi:hypothetical protein
MTDYTTVFVTGKVYWAKVIGEPRLNYDGDGKEWTYDFVPDDTTFLKEHMLLDRLKEDKTGVIPGPYLRLKKPAANADGDKNDPIAIYDTDNVQWDDRLLGNGTEVVAKLTVVNWGKTKKKSLWTSALMVSGLVPYVSNAFAGFTGVSSSGSTVTKKSKQDDAGPAVVETLDELDDAPFPTN